MAMVEPRLLLGLGLGIGLGLGFGLGLGLELGFMLCAPGKEVAC